MNAKVEQRHRDAGWKPHHGGGGPIFDPDTLLDIRTRGGTVSTMKAGAVIWHNGTYIPEANCHLPYAAEVVAYRIATAPDREVVEDTEIEAKAREYLADAMAEVDIEWSERLRKPGRMYHQDEFMQASIRAIIAAMSAEGSKLAEANERIARLEADLAWIASECDRMRKGTDDWFDLVEILIRAHSNLPTRAALDKEAGR